MKVLVIQVGMLGTNCYIIYNENTLEGVIIDPGEDAKHILNVIEEKKLKIEAIFLTHGHHDHIGALKEVKESLKVDVYLNKNDNYLVEEHFAGMLNQNEKLVDIFYADGDIIKKAGFEFKIFETPGHTRGGVCILCGEIMFSGDSIFAESIGRTDFPGGSYEDLLDSIKSKILPLGDSIMLLPGHGPSTTIGHEKMYNPFLR